MNRLHDIVPSSVPRPFGASWCRNFKPRVFIRTNATPDTSQQYVMKMEYFPRGDLHNFLDGMHRTKKLTDAVLNNCIAQVLSSLRQIQKRLPSFRHNDLHLRNVLVGDMPAGNVKYYNSYGIPSMGFRCVIYDFNLATMAGVTNPNLLIPKFQTNYGIHEGNSDKYDMHFFLNSILDWLTKNARGGKYSETRDFLNRALPAGYQGNTGSKVSLFRLKPGVSTNSLASLQLIFNDPYFKHMRNLYNAPEEGELIELPPVNKSKIAKNRTGHKVVHRANGPAPAVRRNGGGSFASNFYKLPPAAYTSKEFQVFRNLLTSPSPTEMSQANINKLIAARERLGGEPYKPKSQNNKNAERRERERHGFLAAEKELIKIYRSKGIPSYRTGTRAAGRQNVPVVPPPPTVRKNEPAVFTAQKYSYAFKTPKAHAPIKTLNLKQAPRPVEVKAPRLANLKPKHKSAFYKSVENMLKNANRGQFSYEMGMKNYASGGSLPTIKIDAGHKKCQDVSREMLDLIAMEHGLDPKLYKSKPLLCAALKRLHNAP